MIASWCLAHRRVPSAIKSWIWDATAGQLTGPSQPANLCCWHLGIFGQSCLRSECSVPRSRVVWETMYKRKRCIILEISSQRPSTTPSVKRVSQPLVYPNPMSLACKPHEPSGRSSPTLIRIARVGAAITPAALAVLVLLVMLILLILLVLLLLLEPVSVIRQHVVLCQAREEGAQIEPANPTAPTVKLGRNKETMSKLTCPPTGSPQSRHQPRSQHYLGCLCHQHVPTWRPCHHRPG